jgi:hypothetical protein
VLCDVTDAVTHSPYPNFDTDAQLGANPESGLNLVSALEVKSRGGPSTYLASRRIVSYSICKAVGKVKGEV